MNIYLICFLCKKDNFGFIVFSYNGWRDIKKFKKVDKFIVDIS